MELPWFLELPWLMIQTVAGFGLVIIVVGVVIAVIIFGITGLAKALLPEETYRKYFKNNRWGRRSDDR